MLSMDNSSPRVHGANMFGTVANQKLLERRGIIACRSRYKHDDDEAILQYNSEREVLSLLCLTLFSKAAKRW